MIRIIAYDSTSGTAKRLSKCFTGLLIKRFNSKYKYNQDDLIINWGCSSTSNNFPMLNNPDSVKKAINKKLSFKILEDKVPIPQFALHKTYAELLFENDDDIVYQRKALNKSKGKGIVIAKNKKELIDCELYTKGIRYKREYRVAVFKNKVIDVISKAQKNKENQDVTPDLLIRNSTGGWIFTRSSIKIPENIKKELNKISINAVLALGLDFGSVDIVRDVNNKLYVLEVNTAPGIVKTGVKKYANAFINFYIEEFLQ